jgi:hypothetical protein
MPNAKKVEDFKSHNDLEVSLTNNKRLKNNFSISISEIAVVSKIFAKVGESSVEDQGIQYKFFRP